MKKINTPAEAYVAASGGSSTARVVKTRIFGIGKSLGNGGDHVDSALAQATGVAATAVNARLMPQKAQVATPVDRPI